VDPSESSIDQIDFEHAIHAIIIFLFYALKSVKGSFRIEHDQRVIIKFLLNEKADGRGIADKLQTQFDEHAYKFRTVQFWITEI
jgi:hypothetical protein